MALVLPTEGSDDGEWDLYLNAALELVDAHDHSTGKGVKVKTNGLDIDADLSMASGGEYSAITNAKAVDFQPQAAAALAAFAGALFTNSDDSNNLYFRTQAGTNVRITNGAVLDTTTSGGIGGDYSSVPAELNFVDASKTYTFKSSAAGNWSRLQSGPVRIAEFATTVANYVELASPAALASNYTVTFPAAVPASTSLVQMSSAGVLTASPTGAVACGAITSSGAISAPSAALSAGATVGTTLGVTGAATVGSTLEVTGLITATAGVTAAANQHVTVSGTGRLKHGNIEIVIGMAEFTSISGTWTMAASGGTGMRAVAGSGSESGSMPITLPVGSRIRSYTIHLTRASGTPQTLLFSTVLATGSETSSAGVNVTSGTSRTSMGESGLDITVATGVQYFIRIDGGGTGTEWYGVSVTYDHP
jgi:hypothetical protein